MARGKRSRRVLASRPAARPRRTRARRIDRAWAIESVRAGAAARGLDRDVSAPARRGRRRCQFGTDDGARRATSATCDAGRRGRARGDTRTGHACAFEFTRRYDADQSSRGHDAAGFAARHARAGHASAAEPAGRADDATVEPARARPADHAGAFDTVDPACARSADHAHAVDTTEPPVGDVTASSVRSTHHASPDADHAATDPDAARDEHAGPNADAAIVGRAAPRRDAATHGFVDSDPASAPSAVGNSADRVERCDPLYLARNERRTALDAG